MHNYNLIITKDEINHIFDLTGSEGYYMMFSRLQE